MLYFLIQQAMEEAIAEANVNGSSIPIRGNGMTHESRKNLSWYEIGKQQGIRAGRLGGEVQNHARDFADEEENAAWIDGVLEGVMSVGARIAAVTSVQDYMPGSKGGLVQVIIVEGTGNLLPS